MTKQKPIEQQTLSQMLSYEPSEPQWAVLIQLWPYGSQDDYVSDMRIVKALEARGFVIVTSDDRSGRFVRAKLSRYGRAFVAASGRCDPALVSRACWIATNTINDLIKFEKGWFGRYLSDGFESARPWETLASFNGYYRMLTDGAGQMIGQNRERCYFYMHLVRNLIDGYKHALRTFDTTKLDEVRKHAEEELQKAKQAASENAAQVRQ